MPYVYAFFADDAPFYVGKANDPRRRLSKHLSNLRSGSALKLYNKLRKLHRDNLDWELRIIEQALEDVIDDRERWWIAHYRSEGYDLCNLTDGGEGGSGKLSPEALAKRKKRCEEAKACNNGYVYTEESRAKISKALKGKPKTDEHKQALSKAWKRTPEQIESQKIKSSETLKGKINIKTYVWTSPDGVEYVTERGLAEFCREHNLSRSCMSGVANNKAPHHKKWTYKHI